MMTTVRDYRVAVRYTGGEPTFEVRGRGVRTVLFSVVQAGETFAWCMEPTGGTVGPFEATITFVGPLASVSVADADAAEGQPRGSVTEDSTPKLRFTYGMPPEGFQTSRGSPAIRLVRGGRYVATATGVTDSGVEHAAIAFTAK